MKLMPYTLVLLFFLTACSASHTMMTHPQVTSEVIFISEMIPHHQDAIDSSKLMLTSKNEEIQSLARTIISAQEAEVAMMNQWLSVWYPERTYVPQYTTMMSAIGSTVSSSRDVLFLKDMIKHHEGAIQMARQASELKNIHPEVKTLIDAIISTQSEEIKSMKKMITTLS